MGASAAAVALLLLVAAVLNVAHQAALLVTGSRLRTLQEEGFAGAVALAAVREERATLALGVRAITTLLQLAALAVMALTRVSTWGSAGAVLSTVVGVLLILLVTDLVPHMIAARRPVRIALSSAPMLLVMGRLTRPITAPVRRFEERWGDENLTNAQRELREIREIGEEEGVLEESESRLVERAFRLDELTAWDVMVPRVDIFAWKEELLLSEVLDALPEVPYSRVPVYKDSVDDVTGIVYVREVYHRVSRGEQDLTLGSVAREPFFVPGSLSLTQLLEDFQVRRIHMGIVADEFGGTDGLVTLEDILEELVGEIHDETDLDPEEIVRVSEDVVECSASVDVRDLDDAMGISLPKAEHRSLNGFILEELGHVPPQGESFERHDVRFEILEATETQVLRARLTKLAGGENGAEGD